MKDMLTTLCFGQSLSQFLRQELTLNPLQRLVARRIFVIMGVFALISVSTRMPAARDVAFFLAILLPQAIVTRRNALDVAGLLLKLVTLAILFGLATVIVSQDQGWIRLPLSIGLVFLLMFNARVRGYPNLYPVIPIFFGSLVLYNVTTPDTTIDSALWDLLILDGGAVIACLLLAYVLWPVQSEPLLRQKLQMRIADLELKAEQLLHIQTEAVQSDRREILRLLPGWASDTLKLLEDGIRDETPPATQREEWVDCIMEIDSLAGGLAGYQQSLTQRPSSAELELLRRLKHHLEATRALFAGGKPAPAATDDAAAFEFLLIEGPVSAILMRHSLTAERLREAATRIHQPPTDPAPPPPPSPSPTNRRGPTFPWLHERYWRDNRPVVLWSMKVALACLVVTLMVESLNTGDVNTAMITTIIVADTTLGADYRKSVMRLSGALLGAVLGIVWLIMGQPAADTVAGLMVTLLPFFAVCAWMSATSPRLNYVGLQLGLAFCMVVFSEQAPGSYLGTGWYRVLGILLGISVMGVIDYLFWPARSIDMAHARLKKMLIELEHQYVLKPGHYILTLKLSRQIIQILDSSTRDALYYLDFARIEPGGDLPEQIERIENSQKLVWLFVKLSKVIESRHRIFLKGQRDLTDYMLEEIQAKLLPTYVAAFQVFKRTLSGHPQGPIPDLEQAMQVAREHFESQRHYRALTDQDHAYLDTLLELEDRYIAAVNEIDRGLCRTFGEITEPVSGVSA